jgi:hypothetical protein
MIEQFFVGTKHAPTCLPRVIKPFRRVSLAANFANRGCWYMAPPVGGVAEVEAKVKGGATEETFECN